MFRGIYVALVTPFQKDGKVDGKTLLSLVDRLLEGGVDGLVPTGTTGESATLTHKEHIEVIDMVVKHVRGRVPVIAGTGSNSTEEAIALSRSAEKVGADGVLLIAPYYNRPTQEGLYEHFKAIHDAITLPILLYNIPSRTAVNIEAETVGRLAELPRIVGMKDATSSVAYLSSVLKRVPENFSLFAGDDAFFLPILSLGGVGVISVVAHLFPGELKEMQRKVEEGDLITARKIHLHLYPLMEALFLETNPAPIKEALYLLGWIPTPTLRLPLVRVKETTRSRLREVLSSLGLSLVRPR
jgi:4-hydroxy-tetrahydrodipicolinate synthase